MDPTNSAASVVALLQLTASLAKVATTLVQDLRDAPRELSAVIRQLTFIIAELRLLAELPQQALTSLLSEQTRAAVEIALREAASNLTDVQEVCLRLPKELNGAGRLRWVFIDSRSAKRALDRLRATESSLNAVLQLLTL